MINLILTLSLTAVNPTPANATAQFRPCVWPNTCTVAPATSTAPAPVIAQFTTCVWPNRCVKKDAPKTVAL